MVFFVLCSGFGDIIHCLIFKEMHDMHVCGENCLDVSQCNCCPKLNGFQSEGILEPEIQFAMLDSCVLSLFAE